MRNFIVLRIISIITGAGMIVYMVTVLSMADMYIKTDKLWMLFLNQTVLGILLSHSIVVHFILRKNYPNHEIQKPTRIYYKISTITAWIVISFLLFGIFVIALSRFSNTTNATKIFMIVFAVIAILYIIQLIIGARLIKKIDYNVHCRMLNSFDSI